MQTRPYRDAIQIGRRVSSSDFERLGPLFEVHPCFPKKINTEFVQVMFVDVCSVCTPIRRSPRYVCVTCVIRVLYVFLPKPVQGREAPKIAPNCLILTNCHKKKSACQIWDLLPPGQRLLGLPRHTFFPHFPSRVLGCFV